MMFCVFKWFVAWQTFWFLLDRQQLLKLFGFHRWWKLHWRQSGCWRTMYRTSKNTHGPLLKLEALFNKYTSGATLKYTSRRKPRWKIKEEGTWTGTNNLISWKTFSKSKFHSNVQAIQRNRRESDITVSRKFSWRKAQFGFIDILPTRLLPCSLQSQDPKLYRIFER